jgi:hypothetical protein
VAWFGRLNRWIDLLTVEKRAELRDIVRDGYHQVTTTCVITMEPLVDPVQTTCGHVCERDQANIHFRQNRSTRCFYCMEELGSWPLLFPRHDIVRAIENHMPAAEAGWWEGLWREVLVIWGILEL